jgi:5-methylcytosine-specific restriction endonuclease McrA
VINHMRRLFMWHPRLKEVAARTRVAPGQHFCEECKSQTHYKEMRYDHVEPAVEFSGFRDFGTYARRMLDAVPDGIQHLCKPCHDLKTAWEREQRVMTLHNRKRPEAS